MQVFNEGAGDRNTSTIFTAQDFGFSLDDSQTPDDMNDGHHCGETLDSVRAAALTPPPGLSRPTTGLFGGSPSFMNDSMESMHLFYEDSPLKADSDEGERKDSSSTPNTRSRDKSKQLLIIT